MSKLSGILTILGCGCSKGTPQIGNFWGACDPNEPKNNRMRASVAVTCNQTNLVIDTGPDFREQINRAHIDPVTAVLYTHAHSDHVAGIDELRGYYDRSKKRMPIYLDQQTFDDLTMRMSFIFEQKNILYAPIVEPHIWTRADYHHDQKIGDVSFIPFPQEHGQSESLGFRFGDVAYSTDMINLSQDSIKTLKGIRTWVVDCANMNDERIFVHANLKRVLELRDKIGVEHVYLTHLKANLDYQTMLNTLPQGLEPAYDGLKIPISWS